MELGFWTVDFGWSFTVADLFEGNKIGGKVLSDLTTDDLKDLATVRLGTVKTKKYPSRMTAVPMDFKLILSSKRKWRKLD